jgi:hypothetical protein
MGGNEIHFQVQTAMETFSDFVLKWNNKKESYRKIFLNILVV